MAIDTVSEAAEKRDARESFEVINPADDSVIANVPIDGPAEVAATVARRAPCSVLMVSPDAAMAEGIAEAVATHFAPAFH